MLRRRRGQKRVGERRKGEEGCSGEVDDDEEVEALALDFVEAL
jgi:hypothetical protein